jgi:hypothetical protein
MTTHSGDHGVKKAGTYLVNKAHVLKSRVSQDELERAIWKTTSSKVKVPNEKHMERILNASFQHFVSGGTAEVSMPSIVSRIEKRMHTHEWVVTLKSLLVFHRILKDASQELHDAVIAERTLFNTSKAKDVSDSEYGRRLDRFIKQYFRYLEERCACTRARDHGVDLEMRRRIEDETFTEMFASWPIERVLQATEFFNQQLATFLQIEIDTSIIDNPTVALGWMYLVQDSRQLTSVITDRCMYLLDLASQMAPEEKKRLVDIFRTYNGNLEGINKLYAGLKDVQTFHGLPQMTLLPLAAVEAIIREDASPKQGQQEIEVCSLEDILGPSSAPPPPPPPPPPKPPQQTNALDDLFH